MSDFSKNRVFGLDLLRAISILCVLFSHGSGFLLREFHFLFVPIVYAGFIGVESFFVLSGFLVGSIAYRSCKREFSWKIVKNFWIRRWFRTLPNYFLFLLINIALLISGVYLMPFKDPSNVHVQVLSHAIFMQSFIDYRPNIFFGESWSLAIEEWFYLFIMLFTALFMIITQSPKKAFYGGTFMLVVIPLLLRVYFVLTSEVSWLESNRTVIFHLDSIAWGVVGAIIIDQKVKISTTFKLVLFILGLILLIFASCLFCYLLSNKVIDSSFFGRTFMYTLISLSLLMLFPVFLLLETSKLLFKRIITSISLWSYSLYLLNLPLFYLLDLIPNLSALTKTFLFVALCMSISAAIYNLYEKPLTNLRQRWSE